VTGEIIRPRVRCRPWSPARATVALRASADELYQLIADYDDWESWAPEIEAARSLAREGDLALAEIDFAGEQEPTVFECVHATESELRMRRIGGPDRIQALRWRLQPVDDELVELALDLRLSWGMQWRAPNSRPAGRWLRHFARLAAHRCREFPLRQAGERTLLEVFDVDGRLEIRRDEGGREPRASFREESR
jgi:ribosome-associated toxin RatA of RatAB toxin-antitoxin module